MKIFILILITLLGILLITLGCKKNNVGFKIIGYILLLPILITISLLFVQCNNNKVIEKKHVNTVKTDSIKSVETEPQSKMGSVVKSTGNPDFNKLEIQFNELMKNYEHGLINAINKNDFSQVEPYMVKNSSLYQSQKKLVSDLFSQGITENLLSYETGILYTQSDPTIFKLEVVEKVEIQYPQKGKVTKDFQWIYTINLMNNDVKLSQIEKWTNFQNDITRRKASVKSDGFYAEMLINNTYDYDLVERLNHSNNIDLDEFFENDTAKEKNLQVIKTIRSKGTEFQLKKSEVLNMTSNSPYEGTKKTTISYKDNNSNKNELSIELTLVIKEYRVNSIAYGGYARIIDIKDIKIK